MSSGGVRASAYHRGAQAGGADEADARRASGAAHAHAGGGRTRVRGRRVRGRRRRRPEGLVHPAAGEGRGPPSCSSTAGCGTGSATSPARCRCPTWTSTSCPRPRRCTTRASTCCCSTCAGTARATAGCRMTYGPVEARDYVGAVAYLRTRADVDGERIGALGTSMGGEHVALRRADAQPIKAMLAIQPPAWTRFNRTSRATSSGRWARPMLKPVDPSTPRAGAAAGQPRPGRPRPRPRTRSSSTCRAPATSGARWRSWRRSRPRRRNARAA